MDELDMHEGCVDKKKRKEKDNKKGGGGTNPQMPSLTHQATLKPACWLAHRCVSWGLRTGTPRYSC